MKGRTAKMEGLVNLTDADHKSDLSATQSARAKGNWKKVKMLGISEAEKRNKANGVFFAGTFDLMHKGHVDTIQQAVTTTARVIVGVANSTGKNTTLSLLERFNLARQVVKEAKLERNVKVVAFNGSAAEAAKNYHSKLLRSVRPSNAEDKKFEDAMARVNEFWYGVPTIRINGNPIYSQFSSTKARQAWKEEQDTTLSKDEKREDVAHKLSALVPTPVANYLRDNKIPVKPEFKSNGNLRLYYAADSMIGFYQRCKSFNPCTALSAVISLATDQCFRKRR